MRVSVVNFCSTAIEMLRFSSDQLMRRAGTNDYDYIVTTWNPSEEVQKWIDANPSVLQASYKTNHDLLYVPNLRAQFNRGFEAGYQLNDYVVIVNTDMAFAQDWLVNLVRRATPRVIPNSLHITPIEGPNVVTANLGIPTEATFNHDEFDRMVKRLKRDKVETEEDRGGWRATQTMPYVVHRKWWEHCGPWGTEHRKGGKPPDWQFFERVHEAGAKYILCHDSVCYHHEAVERRSSRPIGVETMREGL